MKAQLTYLDAEAVKIYGHAKETGGTMGKSSPGVESRSFELTADHALYVDRLVAEGAFATASDVVNAGLQSLRERDGDIERWLHEDVLPTYDRMQADPGRGLSSNDVGRRLQLRHEERLRAEGQCDEA